MRIDVLTLFPQMFESLFCTGIFKRAIENKLVEVNVYNIRDYTHDKHHIVDDTPYGGGAGMLLKPEPVFEAVEAIKAEPGTPIVLLSPQGRVFTQEVAQELAKHDHLILICGHYEGVDERISEHLATDEISIGDYVLSGGELPAMVMIDAITRLVPSVLGSESSPVEESHSTGLLEYPQYTRPPVFRDWAVPDVLLSGNHAQIAKWHRQQAIKRTKQRRPELLDKAKLNPDEKQLVNK